MIKLTTNFQKILILIILNVSIFTPIVFAEEIGVSARVKLANQYPKLLSIIPSYSPVVLSTNTIQGFSINLQDFEGDDISYTITAEYGATYPISGNITNTSELISGEAFIDFIYLSNPLFKGKSKITITLNDSNNSIITKNIDIYTY